MTDRQSPKTLHESHAELSEACRAFGRAVCNEQPVKYILAQVYERPWLLLAATGIVALAIAVDCIVK